MISLSDLDKYRFQFEIQVRYSDMDMLGHANNAVYLTYLELARLGYFKEVIRQEWKEVALVLAHASMDYKIPVTPKVTPVAHIRTTKLGNSSMHVENMITNKEGNILFFSSTMILVAIDTKTGKSTPIPESEKQKVIAYEPALEAV
ncbi:acyl-CoA thioester hydrolase [Catalinimonas alkaloidigena]|uniref:acyl-CoA thioesterase n=1 Tax=Catalinimonas alkaloidigena TaxID=1075417 RepID=UPI002404F6BA|nr:thioesterase family protein [Catalinimonas alkaloidigena]MDF9800061.1 acyl-CoA thioester hydrolase [Catalinimonas alkaloidigena]